MFCNEMFEFYASFSTHASRTTYYIFLKYENDVTKISVSRRKNTVETLGKKVFEGLDFYRCDNTDYRTTFGTHLSHSATHKR